MRDLASTELRLEKQLAMTASLETKLGKTAEDVKLWRSKYENDVAAKAEELEDVR